VRFSGNPHGSRGRSVSSSLLIHARAVLNDRSFMAYPSRGPVRRDYSNKGSDATQVGHSVDSGLYIGCMAAPCICTHTHSTYPLHLPNPPTHSTYPLHLPTPLTHSTYPLHLPTPLTHPSSVMSSANGDDPGTSPLDAAAVSLLALRRYTEAYAAWTRFQEGYRRHPYTSKLSGFTRNVKRSWKQMISRDSSPEIKRAGLKQLAGLDWRSGFSYQRSLGAI
jgi:hypothetical protein